MRRPGDEERLLALKLAGTAECRAAELPAIHRLARTVDYDWLATGRGPSAFRPFPSGWEVELEVSRS